jgi:hypothetical protein
MLRGLLTLVILTVASIISAVRMSEYGNLSLSWSLNEIFSGAFIFAVVFFASFLFIRVAIKNKESISAFFFFLAMGIILAISSLNIAIFLSINYIEFTVFFTFLLALVSIVALFNDIKNQTYNDSNELEKAGCGGIIRKIEFLSLDNFIIGFSSIMILFILPAIGSLVLTNLLGLHQASNKVFFGGISIFSTIFIAAFLSLCIADYNKENKKAHLFFSIAGKFLFILDSVIAIFLFYKYVEFTIYFTPLFTLFGPILIESVFTSKKIKQEAING